MRGRIEMRAAHLDHPLCSARRDGLGSLEVGKKPNSCGMRHVGSSVP